MEIRRILVTSFVAAAMAGSGLVLAASKTQTKEQSSNNGCKEMMSTSAMPQLPPGNAKLELQMRAEMMQKMSEILAKYADRISVDKGSTQ